MKIQATDIKKFIVRRCNERIRVFQMYNKGDEKFIKATRMKYELENIFSQRLLCKYLLDHLDDINFIMIKVSEPGKNGYEAYISKLGQLDELTVFAKSYLNTLGMRGNIDMVIMRNAGQANYIGGN